MKTGSKRSLEFWFRIQQRCWRQEQISDNLSCLFRFHKLRGVETDAIRVSCGLRVHFKVLLLFIFARYDRYRFLPNTESRKRSVTDSAAAASSINRWNGWRHDKKLLPACCRTMWRFLPRLQVIKRFSVSFIVARTAKKYLQEDATNGRLSLGKAVDGNLALLGTWLPGSAGGKPEEFRLHAEIKDIGQFEQRAL